ncbi:MAG TPA: PilZ domain-containing protein [Sphingomonas sp.]|jgi:hypothetical protein
MTNATLPSDQGAADPAAAASARGRKRDSLFLLARMTLGGDGVVHDVRVRNLSEGGVMAEFDRVVPADTVVTLDLRGIGHVEGRIVWCEQRRLGIAFDHPIDPMLARKPVGRGSKTPIHAKPAPRR